MSRNRNQGLPTASGPGHEPKATPTVGAAISLALTWASRAADPATFYVRDENEHARYHVTREEDGSVTTTPVRGDD